MAYKIYPVLTNDFKKNNTIIFAAQELQKYLSAVSDSEFLLLPTEKYNGCEKNSIYIGINLCSDIPKTEDSDVDDAIYINTKSNSGIISGNNAHSTLIAVYRFLKEKGFCFLKPGQEYEIYPDTLSVDDVYVCEKASYRHRGVCIEGSVFQENLFDMIDWLPKAAMNGYFIQFQLPRTFFDRWYKGETPYREKTELTDTEIRTIVALAESEIEKRSLIYHGVGHGWTSEAFGIEGTAWAVHEEPLPEYQDVLALVNGERKLWGGIPLDTNLCYSTPKARQRVTDNIVNYLKKHQNVTYLHFWLADGTNNNCECEECRKLRTSDYYVMMLNELDEKLTKAGINTKIVFILYVDLLWKPISEKLKNKDRFVMMFAPITRSFSSSYDTDSVGDMKPYELNKLEFPINIGENIAYLYDWKKDFDGDSFDYDYHFIWDHYRDFAQYKLAQILCEDVKKLKDMKLNGLMSCQVHRVFLPTSLGMNVMTETLWNIETDFDETANRILKTEFGEKYELVKNYLLSLSEKSCAEALRGEKDFCSDESCRDLKCAMEIIKNFMPVITAEIENNNLLRIKNAWKKLKFHGELYNLMLNLYLDFAKGNGIGDYSNIKDFVCKNEVEFKDEFDGMFFLHIFENTIIAKLKKKLPIKASH